MSIVLQVIRSLTLAGRPRFGGIVYRSRLVDNKV